jgi:hypothetical protein
MTFTQCCGAIQIEIDISGAGNLDLPNAGNGAGGGFQLFGDSFRRLLQSFRQLETNRTGQFSHFTFGRLIQNDVWRFNVP